MPVTTRYVDDDTLEIVGAIDGFHARDVAQDLTERITFSISQHGEQTYRVTLGNPRPAATSIYREARARGVHLDDGDVVWNRHAQRWIIDGRDAGAWLDAHTPAKIMFVVAARTIDKSGRWQQVTIQEARYVLADNAVDAIKALALFADGVEVGELEIQTEGALTFAAYKGTSALTFGVYGGTSAPRFVACTSETNKRLMIADPTGAVITA